MSLSFRGGEPADPIRTTTIIDEEICDGLVALLKIDAPSQWILVHLTIRQSELGRAQAARITAGVESTVARTAEVHQPGVIAVP